MKYKPGDRCPLCGEGRIAVEYIEADDEYRLFCLKCGRAP